ncbi:transposable element Tcb2 transposase [Trichonephila clavipes]|nr:transposable element Tcb2 transposase [Trichonephila clavipes]
MKAGWSARQVARQLGRSNCVLRRCWEQGIREMSFTRRPGSGRPRKTSYRENDHMERNARVQSCSANEVPGLQRNGARSSLETNPDSISAVMTIVRVWRPRGERINPVFTLPLLQMV